MYLFFDTETTGFPQKGVPARSATQARVCQLALLLCNKDGTSVAEFSTLIRPDGWSIGPGAAKVHGHTDEICRLKGIPARVALDVFVSMSEQADTLIAHNKAFDSQMMSIECEALGAEFPKFHQEHCTMLATKNICKLPGRYGDYKWPKLEESLRILCGREIGDDAHDAMVDTKACRDIFFELQNRKEKVVA